MSGVDVKNLADEKLSPGKFPVDPRADFRLHIAPDVRRGIQQHATADVKVEICGVLVGNWHTDENGPFLAVTNYIRCDTAASKFAEVTFTHESWAQINKEMDSKFADARIVGWYHSHPDFGIFLSERDCFIHENFFSSPGQIAYVIDPVRDLEGVFAWRGGKPTALSHFWIGNTIRTVEASERNVAGENAAHSGAAASIASAQAGNFVPGRSSYGFITTAMGLLLMFLLGYLYGGWRSRWEQQMLVEGVVAYFANAKVLRPGLEDDVAQVRERLKLLTSELSKLPPPSGDPSKEQAEEATKRLKIINDNMALCVTKLADIEQRYGFSDEERRALAWLIAQKEAELRRIAEEQAKAKSNAETGVMQPKPDKPVASTPAPTESKAATPAPTREQSSSSAGSAK
jgi:proteasome lid subunit RPN8/RPN11